MKVLITAVLLLTASLLAAEDAEVYTLDNGLQVVLDRMDFAPTVVVLVQYRVGARNEAPGISGISHFTEHMMFNGTPDMPGSRFWQLVQMEGGNANGGTGMDFTSYHIYFPSTRLEKALRIEADRMQNCLMDSAAIAQEIGVVTDEWRLMQDSPDNQLYSRARQEFFGDHPLARSVIGTGETIAAFDEESVREYYETWYRPSNAVLVVAGDFQRDEAAALIEEYFGRIHCDGPVPDNVPEITEWDYPERVDMEFPAQSDRFLVYFRGCGPDSPDIPALMLLSAHFSGGRLGWMQRELVNGGLLTSGYSSAPYGLDTGPFSFYGNVQEGVDVDSVIDIVVQEVFATAGEPLPERRVSTLQDYLVARQLTSVDTPVSQAWRHAYYLSTYGDIDAYDRILEEISALTAEDLREVAAKYFTPDRMMVAVLHAAEGASGMPETSTAGTTETEVPEVTDWSGLDLTDEFVLPESSISEGVERFRLNNGLVLLVKEDHSFPIVEIMAAVPMCVRRENPDMCGISSLTSELMLRGTDELDYEAFHERLAVLGSSTWIAVNDNYSMANVYGLSRNIDTFFVSLSDLLMRPALTEDDFQSVQTQQLGNLAVRMEQPFYAAFLKVDDVLLSEGNGRTETGETVSSITRNDAEEWWRTCVRPEGAVITVVGDITPEEALALTELHFEDWTNPEEPLPELVPLEFRDGPSDTLVMSMPGKVQVAEIVACRAPAYTSEDYIPFAVMNRILGGGIGSRLGQNIRETQGLAYIVGSRLDGPASGSAGGSRFIAMLATGAPTASRALDAVLHEIDRMKREDVAVEELLIEQSRSIGRHALSYDSYDSQARYLAACEATGVPLDIDLRELEQKVRLTVDDIREAAAGYFTGSWFMVVAGGVDEKLQPLQ